jgi:CheY-like chemotaxis protein
MPDKDGFYFVEQLKAAGGDTRVVLMLSSANQTGTQRRCRELGISGYMLKPVTRFAMYRAIADILSLHEQTRPSEAATAALEATPMDAERVLNILVAEDNEDNQMLIKSYLKKTPHRLALAENGAVAVEHCKTTAYDLIFMDVQMPVMDGYSATASIRQWEQVQQRPPSCIIALTANALAEDVQKSLAAGCNGHLRKPIKKATLLASIAEYAGREMPTV